jgi:Raf kinase inhibitor-like YbhB/YbcL family protein
MQLMSSDFSDGDSLPPEFTGVGKDVSPSMQWSGWPSATETFALTCQDPDAPRPDRPRPEGPWVHWVIYNIPGTVHRLPAGIPRAAVVDDPSGALQGKNDFSDESVGYRGPLPPRGSGTHRYVFKLYAVDCTLELAPASADKAALLTALAGHVLAEAALMGRFERR